MATYGDTAQIGPGVTTKPGLHSLNLGGRSEAAPEVLDEKGQFQSWMTILGLVGVLFLVFFDSLWRNFLLWLQPQYQFGFIIPVIAAALIWYRRKPFVQVSAWERWVGVSLIAAGMAIRVIGSLLTVYYLDNVALVPCLIGVFVLVGGLKSLRWALAPLLFLLLMYPLPRGVESRIMFPMQKLATKASTAALVSMGIDSWHDGNTQIFLASRQSPMNVAEQCSGLRMLTIFTAMAVAFALFATDRPLWERIVIVLSAFPIAVAVNVARIALTGTFLTLLDWWGWSSDMFEKISHDFAGLFMMPLALGLLYLVFQLLKHLFIDAADEVHSVAIPR